MMSDEHIGHLERGYVENRETGKPTHARSLGTVFTVAVNVVR
jgi:hypothetical protein